MKCLIPCCLTNQLTYKCSNISDTLLTLLVMNSDRAYCSYKSATCSTHDPSNHVHSLRKSVLCAWLDVQFWRSDLIWNDLAIIKGDKTDKRATACSCVLLPAMRNVWKRWCWGRNSFLSWKRWRTLLLSWPKELMVMLYIHPPKFLQPRFSFYNYIKVLCLHLFFFHSLLSELLNCDDLHSVIRLVLKAGNYMNAVGIFL